MTRAPPAPTRRFRDASRGCRRTHIDVRAADAPRPGADAVGLISDDHVKSRHAGRGGRVERPEDQRLAQHGMQELGVVIGVLETVAVTGGEDHGGPKWAELNSQLPRISRARRNGRASSLLTRMPLFGVSASREDPDQSYCVIRPACSRLIRAGSSGSEVASDGYPAGQQKASRRTAHDRHPGFPHHGNGDAHHRPQAEHIRDGRRSRSLTPSWKGTTLNATVISRWAVSRMNDVRMVGAAPVIAWTVT